MEPYYADEHVALYHGDSLELLSGIEPDSVDVLLTDPPYFNVKEDDWDRQWGKRDEFLRWLGSALDAATPALRASASLWVFASPALTSTIELQVVAPRFRVLNSIRWVKENGWHQKADPAAQRRYLTAWEGIVLAEQFHDAYKQAAGDLHKLTFRPLGAYLQGEWERAGFTRGALEVALGYTSSSDPTKGTALAYRWQEGSSLPTRETYAKMRETLGPGYLPRDYDDLRAEHESLSAEFVQVRARDVEPLRRPFNIERKAGPVTDVWTFPTVAPYKGKHPCEKPQTMLAHMIEATSRPNDLILDPFAGSGSTLRVARSLGRRSIGIEQDEKYCERIAHSLSQDALFV